MSECSGNCSSCSENCGSRQEDLRAAANPGSHVKKMIAIVSGKGGVGKSTVTSLLAAGMNRRGKSAAVLDADITGPSIPKAFGVSDCGGQDEQGLYPGVSPDGVQLMSINLLLEDESSPVLWRGPVLAGAVKQFWTDVVWGDVDFMFVDMPPGTGDVPLTVFQSLPIDGVIIVTSPQDLVSMIVEKAVKMAKMMNIPVLGFIENYSYLNCPDCGKKIYPFGQGRLAAISKESGIPVLARLPMNPEIAAMVDAGCIEKVYLPDLDPVLDKLVMADMTFED